MVFMGESSLLVNNPVVVEVEAVVHAGVLLPFVESQVETALFSVVASLAPLATSLLLGLATARSSLAQNSFWRSRSLVSSQAM